MSASSMTKPLNYLAQICWKPQYKGITTTNCESKEIFCPFVGFVLFFLGKILVAIPVLVGYNDAFSDFFKKPFTVYYFDAFYFLSSLGLHVFITLQEFIFYGVNNYHNSFVRCLMKSTGDMNRNSNPRDDQDLESLNLALELQITSKDLDNTPETFFHEAMVDLTEMMKYIIQMFGPFLLQNLSLMLLYWLLHVYNVAFLGIKLFNAFNEKIDNQEFVLLGPAFAGSALIMRWVFKFLVSIAVLY